MIIPIKGIFHGETPLHFFSFLGGGDGLNLFIWWPKKTEHYTYEFVTQDFLIIGLQLLRGTESASPSKRN